MKIRTILMFAALALSSAAFCSEITEVIDNYEFTLRLKVPMVLNNMSSQGRRVMKTNTIKGTMRIIYSLDSRPRIEIIDLVNKTHKLSSGRNVTYTCSVGDEWPYCRVNLIGDNKKRVFKMPSVMFHLSAFPSYAIGDVASDDNSLYLALTSRTGSCKTTKLGGVSRQTIKRLYGYVAGTQGCGCTDYGHTSPTRVAGIFGPTCDVDDVAGTAGRWKASYVSTTVVCE